MIKDYRILLVSLLSASLLGTTGCGGQKSAKYIAKRKHAQPIVSSNLFKDPKVVSLNNDEEGNELEPQNVHPKSDIDDSEYNELLTKAEKFLNLEQKDEAREILNQIPTAKLNGEILNYKRILDSYWLLYNDGPRTALRELSGIHLPSTSSKQVQYIYHKVKAEAYSRLGNIIQAVSEKVIVSELLASGPSKIENDGEIWTLLNQLTPNSLTTFVQAPPPDILTGWVSLAYITKQEDTSADELVTSLKRWQSLYPNHPASLLLPGLNDINKANIEAPKHIGLLLPLNEPYTSSSKAIQDGFLAAFYDKKDFKPKVTVYNTQDPSGVIGAYKQAIDDGVNFIVGPLTKEEVQTVSLMRDLQVPVIALNNPPTVYQGAKAENLFYFSMPPEAEALSVVDKTWQKGHRKALVVVPDNEWGKRMETTFRQYFEIYGGKIVKVATYTEGKDLSNPIRELLDINQSNNRAKNLRAVLNTKINFEPRRRQDPDMVFLAATPRNARQLKPLLNFYYAKSLPVYATSSIFTGHENKRQDKDLDGVYFCDMPWVLNSTPKISNMRTQISNLWPESFEQHTRLFAFGMDAYNLTNQLNNLIALPDIGTQGLTGKLKLNQERMVLRDLTWAKIEKGKPKIVQ